MVLDKKISILGCGWLGLPLAIQLIANGWKVKGSTTSPHKIKLLSLNEIEPYLVHLQQITALSTSRFWDSGTLLINIPPGLRKQSAEDYLLQMEQLANVVAASGIRKVVFISSTSVYPEWNKVISDVNEVDQNSPLYLSEKLFTQNPNFKTTVIRFAGLIGPDRPPSRFFAGKKDIPNGRAPVNLIQLDDCIGIIKMILNEDRFGETYHAASPSHPTRAEFYTASAKNAGLIAPEFVDELKEWKVIDSSQLPYIVSPLVW